MWWPTLKLSVPITYDLREHISGKVYIYRFDLGPIREIHFSRAHHGDHPLDPTPEIEHLQELSQACLGQRDWQGLARRGDYREDHHCTIRSITWEDIGIERRCTIQLAIVSPTV